MSTRTDLLRFASELDALTKRASVVDVGMYKDMAEAHKKIRDAYEGTDDDEVSVTVCMWFANKMTSDQVAKKYKSDGGKAAMKALRGKS